MEKTVVKAISELDLVSELNEKSEIQQNYFSCVISLASIVLFLHLKFIFGPIITIYNYYLSGHSFSSSQNII